MAVLGVRDQRNFEVLFVAESDVVSSGRVKNIFYNCAWCEFKSADTMVLSIFVALSLTCSLKCHIVFLF